MTQTSLTTILDELAVQRTELVALDEAVRLAMADARALYADSAKMAAFVAAHDARKALLEPLNTWLDAEVRARLAATKAQGVLLALPTGISSPFVDRWNTYLDGSSNAAFILDDVVGALVDVLRQAIGCRAETGFVLLDTGAVQDLLDRGAVATPFRCSDDMLVDFWTGGNFLLTLDAWQPTLHRSLGGGKGTAPAQPRGKTTVLHGTVEFPTGRLLAMDRTPFDATESVIDQVGQGFNINYGVHRVVRSAMLMGQHRIVQISVGNTSPNLHLHGPHLIVGHTEHLTETAHVSTDLWMATIVDVATLHALGVDDAEIDQAIADGEVEALTVAPGTWHVFWSEDARSEDMAERFAGLYPHAPGDEVAVWMTQDPQAVERLGTFPIANACLG